MQKFLTNAIWSQLGLVEFQERYIL